MSNDMHIDFSGWRTGLGPMFMFFFWSVVILGVAFLIRAFWSELSSRQTQGKTAKDIVLERYARGEIDQTEYEQKMQDLERHT
jgi:putative membrane protein